MPDKISKEALAYLDDSTPLEAKMLAARGLAPLPPVELIYVLFHMLSSNIEKIRDQAFQTLDELPRSMIRMALDNITSPQVLEFIASNYIEDIEILEKVIANRHTPNETISFVAEWCKDTALLTYIGENDTRIIEHKEILEKLKKNPHTPVHIIERLIPLIEPQERPLITKEPEPVKTPPTVKEEEEAKEEVEEEIEEKTDIEKQKRTRFPRMFVSDNIPEWQKEELYKKIALLSHEEKLELALFGNTTVRKHLIQDPKREVGLNVLKNPKVNDEDISFYSKLRNIHSDILKTIGLDDDWTKRYGVIHSLARNPRTPLFLVLKFLPKLYESDIAKLARSKDIPGSISQAATKLLRQRAMRKERAVGNR